MLFDRNVQKTVDSPKSARFSKFKKIILIYCQDNANNTNSFGLFRIEKTCLPPSYTKDVDPDFPCKLDKVHCIRQSNHLTGLFRGIKAGSKALFTGAPGLEPGWY